MVLFEQVSIESVQHTFLHKLLFVVLDSDIFVSVVFYQWTALKSKKNSREDGLDAVGEFQIFLERIFQINLPQSGLQDVICSKINDDF